MYSEHVRNKRERNIVKRGEIRKTHRSITSIDEVDWEIKKSSKKDEIANENDL